MRWLTIKEILVGVINGVAWALVVALVAYLWFHSTGIAAVIAAAMVLNLLAAAAWGVAIPLILDRLGIDPALSGNLDLAGERIEGTIFREAVTGRLDLALVIARADLNARRLDLSGTHMRMQAAASSKGKKGTAPVHTEIRFPRAWFESELPLAELSEHPGTPPVSGELKVDGRAANIGIINRFLRGKQRLGVGGDGTLSRPTFGSAGAASHLAVRWRFAPATLRAGSWISRRRAPDCSRRESADDLPRRAGG